MRLCVTIDPDVGSLVCEESSIDRVFLNLLLPVQPNWVPLRSTLDALTTYAVEFRYPGVSADQALATQAFQDCVAIRQIIRQHFSL